MVRVNEIAVCAEEDTVLLNVISAAYAYANLIGRAFYAAVVIPALCIEHQVLSNEITHLCLCSQAQLLESAIGKIKSCHRAADVDLVFFKLCTGRECQQECGNDHCDSLFHINKLLLNKLSIIIISH